jgi:hypothetical protein
MAVKIEITRENGVVKFDPVTVLDTDNVFFVNLDTLSGHHPTLLPLNEPLGKAPPSPPSIQVVPEASYRCRIPGHEQERGTITIITT